MGHLLTIAELGNELVSRGHEFHLVTNNYAGEKATKLAEEFGLQCHFTNDNIAREDFMPGKKTTNPDGTKGFFDWKPFVKEKLLELKFDIIVVDYMSVCGLELADELGLKHVVTHPGLLDQMCAYN